ncbi:MAG: hypothetical protein HN561_07050 [Candidatus Scalindua sp.]|jgi:hypothetical protein|nr:hypothetical protein [Candidatus Scalindua sp.]
MNQLPVWALIAISISGSFITGGFLLALHWLNKKTGHIKATDNFRFEVFKKRFNVYGNLNILVSDILFHSISTKIQPSKKAEFAKASLQLLHFTSSNSLMISPEIATLIETLIKQEQDVELTRKTSNAITTQMELELHLEKTTKINKSLFESIKDEKQKESNH